MLIIRIRWSGGEVIIADVDTVENHAGAGVVVLTRPSRGNAVRVYSGTVDVFRGDLLVASYKLRVRRPGSPYSRYPLPLTGA